MIAGLAAEHGETKPVMIDAWALLSSLPDVDWLLEGHGYDTDGLRDALKDKEIRACIPCCKHRK